MRLPRIDFRTALGLLALLAGAAAPTAAQQCTVEFAQIATLGRLEDSASVQIPSNTSIARVPWGGWLVPEQDQRLLRYNQDGSLNGPFVRVGQGPGELRRPEMVAVDASDSTWISDYHDRALVYGPDGVLGRTVVDPAMDYIHGFTPGGLPYTLGVTFLGGSAEAPDVDPFVRVMDRGGKVVTTYRPGPPGLRVYPSQWAPRSCG